MLESCNVGNFNFQYFNFSTFQLFNGFNTLFMCSAVFSTVFNGFQQTMLKTCFQHQMKQPPAFLLNFFEKNSKKYLTNLQKCGIIIVVQEMHKIKKQGVTKRPESRQNMANQKFTSANTSINSKRLPALFSNSYVQDFVLCCPLSLRCVDIGGGKYDNAVAHFAKFGHVLSVYDKYNRPEEQNKLVLSGSYDVAFCSNVLNVIDSKEERYNVVKLALSLAPELYISVYEGDKSGIGRETKKDCYQLNQSIRFYLDELLEMGFLVDFADSKIIHVVRENGFHEIGSFITRKGV